MTSVKYLCLSDLHLGTSYNLLTHADDYGRVDNSSGAPCMTALALDPENYRGRFAIGYLTAVEQHRLHAGFAQMEDAIKLNPGDSEINALYGQVLDLCCQPKALNYLETACRLDPLSTAAIFLSSHLFRNGRQTDAARIVEPLRVSEEMSFVFQLDDGSDIPASGCALFHHEVTRSFERL